MLLTWDYKTSLKFFGAFRSRSADDEDQETSSRIAAVLPDAKALISDATKKSFHPKTPEAKLSNLMVCIQRLDFCASLHLVFYFIRSYFLLQSSRKIMCHFLYFCLQHFCVLDVY